MMTTIRTTQQLRRAIDHAWSELYHRPTQDLARRAGIHPGPGYDCAYSVVHAHPECRAGAEAAYAAFQAEQDRLNAAYGAHIDAPYLDGEIRADCERAIANAQASVAAAQSWYDQELKWRDETVPRFNIAIDAADERRWQGRQQDLEAARAALATVTEDAQRKRDALLAALQPPSKEPARMAVDAPRTAIIHRIDLGPDAIHFPARKRKDGGTVYILAVVGPTAASFGIPEDAVRLVRRGDGKGRLRFVGDWAQQFDGWTVAYRGVTVGLKWRADRKRAVGRLSAEQMNTILGEAA